MTAVAAHSPTETPHRDALPAPGEQGRHAVRGRLALGLAVVVLLVLVLVALSVGSSGVGVRNTVWAIGSKVSGVSVTEEGERIQTIVFQLRLPRILLAVAAGAGLALSGVAMQAVLHNPMVSPFTLGISSAAAFGASLAIMLGATTARGDARLVGSALAAAAVCGALTLALSWLRQASPEVIILVGLALTYLLTAMTAALQYFASEQQLSQIVRWTFGSVNEATWAHVVILGATALIALPLLSLRATALNAVAFAGDDTARTLGVNVPAVRMLSCTIAITLAAVIVSYTGVIAFVGLVGPHIARLIVGEDHRILVPYAAVAGAILMVGADTLGRTAFAPVVIPVGIVVSFIGAPLFLALILLRRRSLR